MATGHAQKRTQGPHGGGAGGGGEGGGGEGGGEAEVVRSYYGDGMSWGAGA